MAAAATVADAAAPELRPETPEVRAQASESLAGFVVVVIVVRLLELLGEVARN